MALPRKIHKIYAKITGNFWTECYTCGREFGGHEKGGGGKLMGDRIISELKLCPSCYWNQLSNDKSELSLNSLKKGL
jgi:hypothetical protein